MAQTNMLLGEYEHTLDAKNRLTLPAKFRQALGGDEVVLTRGFDPCVYLFARSAFETFVERRLERLDPFSREAREMNRWVFGGGSETEVDRQGRIMVPPALLNHAGLERDVVVAGLRDHIEIWNRAAWRQELGDLEGRAEHVAERLAERHA